MYRKSSESNGGAQASGSLIFGLPSAPLPAPRGPAGARLEPGPGRGGGAHGLDPAKLRDQEVLRAAAVPVVMVGAAGPPHVLNDHVVSADRDLAVATGTAVELARDPADQPRLVALLGEAAEAGARIGQAFEFSHGRRLEAREGR